MEDEFDQPFEDEHQHSYLFSKECGVQVCAGCRHHKGLARCYCGWAESGEDGRWELESLGEVIEPEEYY
jgi:hypothetical protein